MVVSPRIIPVATTTTASVTSMSFVEHRNYVANLIKKWCDDNKENSGLTDFQIEEGVDYTLNIEFSGSSIENASIKCKCRKIVLLAKNENKIQVSNYYKHLQSAGCSLMRELRNAENEMGLVDREQSNIRTNSASSISYRTSPINESIDAPINKQSVSNLSAVKSSSQSRNSGKRRLMAPPTSKSSVKRSRS